MKKLIKKIATTALSIFGIISMVPSAFCSRTSDRMVGFDSNYRVFIHPRGTTAINFPSSPVNMNFDNLMKIMKLNGVINKHGRLDDEWKVEFLFRDKNRDILKENSDRMKGCYVTYRKNKKKIELLIEPCCKGYLSSLKDYNEFLEKCELNLQTLMVPLSGKCVIPGIVNVIGENAFKGCDKLVSVEIPSTVTRIEEGAFSNCFRLKSIYIPNSVKSIALDAFCNCISLNSIEFNGKTYGSVDEFREDFNAFAEIYR